MANRFEIIIQATAKGFSRVKQEISGKLQAGLDKSADAVGRLNAKLSGLEAEYRETQKTLEQVSAFKKLKTDTAALGVEWQQAQDRIASLSREIKTTDGPTGRLRRSFDAQVRSARKLKAQYNENQASLEQMRRSLSSAGIDTKSLGSAQKQLEAKLNATQAEIKQTGAAFDSARKPTVGFFSRARSGVNAFTDRLNQNKRAASGWSTALKGAIAAIGIREVVSGLWNAARQGQNLNIAFQSITGSAAGAQAELGFIRKISNDLKLEFYSTAEGYKEIYAAAKDTPLKGEVQDIFLSVAEASAALRKSQEETNGILRAFSQIISKGKVQAEELRGQIGERLPGAFQLAADSMGITTAELDKLLEQGKVTAEDLLPNLARALHEKFGAAAREAANDTDNMAGGLNEFTTAWKGMLIEIGKSGFIKTATDTLRRLTATLKDPETQQSVTELTSMIFSMIGAVVEITAKYGKWILLLGGGAAVIKKFTGLVLALNAAMLKMTGTGIVAWLGGYVRAAQAATVSTGVLKAAVSSVSTALISALGAVTAFIAGWQFGKVIGEIDVVEKAVQGMYATIDEWITKAQIKVLELSKIWGKLFGSDKAIENIDRAIEAQKRHLDVIERTREKIAAIDDSEKKAAESAIKRAEARMRAAMDEAQAEIDAEAKKRDANRETEEQEEDIYRKKQDRIQGRVGGLELALREEIAAIDLAEAEKRITEEKARQERIQAQREFIQEKLALVREELEKSVAAQAEETEEKLEYERGLKKQIREMEIDLTQLRIRELETQTKAVKEADEEQEKSAREKYRERISFIREETEAQRDVLAKQLEYIDDLEEEGVISHQEAVDRKIQAEMEFAQAKVEQAKKAAEAAKEIHGKESAEYQIAVNKEKQAAEELADKKIESEKRAQEARKSLAKDFGAWLVQYSRETVAESSRTYSEFMSTMQAQMENINQFIYGKSLKQQAQLAGAVRSVQKAFEGTAEAVRDAYGVSIDYSNMTFAELQAEVAGVQNMFRGLMEEMRAGRANIDAIGQGISDWENDVSDVDIAMRDLTDRSSEFQAAWADLWSGSPKTVEETKAAIDRVKSAYSEMVKDGEAAISALMGEWDALEAKITSVEEQIRNLHADTADTIRELNRDLMTDEQAWLDERKQAHEVYNQAIAEMSRGNYEAANELFTEARNLAKGLAREIQNDAGETVMTLEDTTSSAVDLIRRITEAQGGNLEQLKGILENQQTDIRSQIGYTQNMLESTTGKIAQINQQLKLSAQEIKEITNNLPPDWFGAGSDRHKFESGGLTMGPRHSAGGMDINVEGGEFIEPRPAVKKYGPMIFEAFRQLKIDRSAVDYLLSGGRRIMGTGGLVHRSIQAAAPRITAPRPQPKLVFAEGGPVGFAGQAPAIEKVHRVKFDFGRGRSYEGDFSPDQAEGIIRALKTAKLRSN